MKRISENCYLHEKEDGPLIFAETKPIGIWCTVCGKDGENVRKWISVREQMPPKDTQILATNGKKICCAYWWTNNPEAIYCMCDDRTQCIMYKTTHWMLLPGLPKDPE